MNINDLISELTHIAEAHPDAEVRFASQPNWPFEYEISDIAVCNLAEESEAEDDDLREWMEDGDVDEEVIREWMDIDNDEVVVYLGEGSQLGYLPETAKNTLGW